MHGGGVRREEWHYTDGASSALIVPDIDDVSRGQTRARPQGVTKSGAAYKLGSPSKETSVYDKSMVKKTVERDMCKDVNGRAACVRARRVPRCAFRRRGFLTIPTRSSIER
jgi:hypothetical protein